MNFQELYSLYLNLQYVISPNEREEPKTELSGVNWEKPLNIGPAVDC